MTRRDAGSTRSVTARPRRSYSKFDEKVILMRLSRPVLITALACSLAFAGGAPALANEPPPPPGGGGGGAPPPPPPVRYIILLISSDVCCNILIV